MKYNLKATAYALFKIDEQAIEICPVFNKDGEFKGIDVTVYSRDRRNYRDYDVDQKLGAIISNRYVMLEASGLMGPRFTVETKYDLCKFSATYMKSVEDTSKDFITIDYDYRKK